MMYHVRKHYALLACMAALMITACSPAAEEPVQGILVNTRWLADHLNDRDLVILHSGTVEGFDTAHIPGASLILPHSFTVNTSENRNEMPSADSLAALLREAGVSSDSKILLYNENIGLLNRTARVYLALDHVGLGEQTKVLNGGLAAWQEGGYAISERPADPEPGNFQVSNLKEVTVTAAELDRQRWSNQVVVIDARSDDAYYGISEGEDSTEAGGHIEGAYSLSYLKLTADDSPYTFLPDGELEDLLKEAGMVPGKTSLIYCNSGIIGSLNYLVARHLGYPALLYDGSHEEWGDLGLPLTVPLAIPEKTEQTTNHE